LDFLTPFSIFTGLALIVAYALLGVTWLVMKTDGALQRRLREIGQPIAFAVVATIAIVSVWTPYTHPEVATRWFSLPNLIFFLPVPALVLISAWLLLRALRREESQAAPFGLALFLLFLGYTGFAISLWPTIIPPGISIWDAAAPPQSMGFALVGALFIIPIIMTYTAWSYYVFRGKVRAGDGYH
jgi:cytochrome d ubiquinol oxidase subunit II